jgi:hypothetical protein
MRFRILLFLILASLSALAQHNHYIYIQSDNQQNFYIRKGSEIISSSTSGFVILPKIAPGQQEFLVGFPKNLYPEYQFAIDIKGKDRGFALKNFNEKGWGLFDLQSLEVIMGKKIEPKKEEVKIEAGPMTEDPFSVILASAVGDQRIREISLVYREEIVAQTPPPLKAETGKTKTSEIPKLDGAVAKVAVPAKVEPVANEPAVLSKNDPPLAVSSSSSANDPVVKSTATPAKKEEVVKNTATPAKKEEVVKNTATPAKKEEVVKHTDDPAMKSAVVKTVADSAGQNAVVKNADEPANKADAVTNTVEPATSAQGPATEMAGADAGSTQKKWLNIKNPFAKKNNAPVKSEPGVVMIAGAPENGKSGEKKDSVTVKQGDVTVAGLEDNNAIKESVAVKTPEPAIKNSSVTRYMEYKSGKEIVLVFIDHQVTRDDTIRLSIDEEAIVAVDSNKEGTADSVPVSVVNTEKPAVAAVTGNVIPKEKEGKPEVVNTPVVAKEALPVGKDQQVAEKKDDSVAAGVTAEVRTDCRRMASEKDMVSMRKKMIMITDEDEMITIALKDFKSRCYSTERIQNLSYVFTTDKGRYKLFDAAFPYVYDPSNFPLLERLLNDDYYINRFRALVNKN